MDLHLHSAATVIIRKVFSVEIQIPMKAICFPASTCSFFGRPVVNEISKIMLDDTSLLSGSSIL